MARMKTEEAWIQKHKHSRNQQKSQILNYGIISRFNCSDKKTGLRAGLEVTRTEINMKEKTVKLILGNENEKDTTGIQLCA